LLIQFVDWEGNIIYSCDVPKLNNWNCLH
jgi:hypothetical protein